MRSKDVEEIVALLGESDATLARRQALMARLRVIWAATALIVFLGADAWLASRLWSAWRAGEWGDFWPAVRNVWLALPLIGVGSAAHEAGQQAGRARVLRRLIAERMGRGMGETRQPEPLAGRDLPVGPERIGPFERLERDRSLDMVSALVISAPLAAALVIGLVIMTFLAHLQLSPDLFFLGLIFGIPAATFLWLTFAAVRGLRRFRRPFAIVADDWGVEWRGAFKGRPEQMAWHEARAFFTIADPGDDGEAYSAAYVLTAGGKRLAWDLPHKRSPDAAAASERLARLIVTRTHLPLTVVSAAALSPEDYDSRAISPEIASPVGKGATRLLRLAWRVPLLLTLAVTALGLVAQRLHS